MKNNGLLGKKRSEETKEKIRKTLMGHKLSQETKDKISKTVKKEWSLGNFKKCIATQFKKGKNHFKWKGGKIINKDGYLLIWNKKHPNCNYCGYVQKHRLVMEKFINRYLTKNEVVHHINENKLDNRISNLQLMTKSQHMKLHNSLRK